jgi:hypothetical protein
MVARWEGDTAGRGIGDARAFLPGVEQLCEEMERAHWVAEDPELHLLPHLQRVIDAAGSPWVLHSSERLGTIYQLHLGWQREGCSRHGLRADVFALIGAIAELSTHVRERVADDHITFDITTGIMDTDGRFQGHGHLVRLRVETAIVAPAPPPEP